MARTWGGEAHSYSGKRFPDCARCQLPQCGREREAWGCETPSETPVFQVGCGACHGNDYACGRCGGIGVIDLFRCPGKYLGDAPAALQLQVDLLMRCYLQYDTRHVLPVDGGLLDQARTFVAGCDIIDAERGRYESMKEEKRERDRMTAQRRSATTSHGR